MFLTDPYDSASPSSPLKYTLGICTGMSKKTGYNTVNMVVTFHGFCLQWENKYLPVIQLQGDFDSIMQYFC